MSAQSRAAVVGHLPSHLLAGVRGSSRELNEDLWALSRSRAAEAELDAAVLVDRNLRPFADPDLFPPGDDIWPFEAYRSLENRERVGPTTRLSLVEPQCGWTISRPAHLVRRGLINMHNLPAPSMRAYLRTRRDDVRNHPAGLINLRDRGERHYGHVMQDLVGGRLRMASESGLDDLPILVSKRLFERRFFQDLLRLSGLAERQFVLQDHRHEASDEVYLFDTSHFSRASLEYLQGVLRVPYADPSSDRRLFVVRSPARDTGRGVSNMDAVADLCRRFGLEMVATDDMGLSEQIELFSEARLVVGVHGSALVNIVFRKGSKLNLVEIFPPGTDPEQLRPWCFYEAVSLGHDYDCLLGGPPIDGVTGKAAYRRDFPIDIERLAAKLASVLDRT